MADDQLSKAYEAIEMAESALRLAKQALSGAGDISFSDKGDAKQYAEKAAMLSKGSTGEGGRVIEGVFDGQNMIDKKGTVYPVPANYASKSKLVPGDVLKLTVTEEGKFLYKQIGPIERKTVIGPLVDKDGQFQVLSGSKAYNVLLASVTYFRASVGDEVTLIIPMDENAANWGAIEAVLPKFDEEVTVEDDDEDVDKKKDALDFDAELDI